MFIPLIMAGGVGERFWPCSRKNRPKQFLSILSDTTMIEDTVKRLSALAPVEQICIATTADQIDLIHKHLPDILQENILIEPCLRNTAPCIGYAAAMLEERYKEEDIVIGVFPADHVIGDLDIFEGSIRAAETMVREHPLICQIGIQPAFPSTGYGYIHRAEHMQKIGETDIYHVAEFREKPGPETAQEYIDSGEYYWNGGIFVFRPSTMLAEFEKHVPDMHAGLMRIRGGEPVEEVYPGLEKISIDYAIIERTDARCVAEARFAWDDVGAWDAVEKYFEKDENRNVVRGAFTGEDCDECLIFNDSDKLTITGIGLDEMIVVAVDDAVLIVRKDRAQDVKKIVTKLREKGRDELL